MKPILTIFAFLLIAAMAEAQEKATPKKSTKALYGNVLKLSAGTYYIHNRTEIDFSQPRRQYGIYYERKVFKGFYAGAGYTRWKNHFERFGFANGVIEPGYFDETKIGALTSRYNYRMIDVYISYKRLWSKRDVLTVGIGGIYSWGYDVYLRKYFVYPQLPADAVMKSEWVKSNHIGFLPQIGYERLFLKNRFSIGGDLKARIIPGWNPTPPQFDLCISICGYL